MRRTITLAVVLASAVSLVAAAEAGAATRAQYGKKCDAAWTGKRNTKAFSTFKKGCIKTAIAAPAPADPNPADGRAKGRENRLSEKAIRALPRPPETVLRNPPPDPVPGRRHPRHPPQVAERPVLHPPAKAGGARRRFCSYVTGPA